MSDDDCRCGFDDEQPTSNVQPPMRSGYRCPVCELHLSLEDVLSGGVALFCANKDCPSWACANGVESKTEGGASDKLCRLVEQEVGMNERL